MSLNEKMTTLADEVRELSGTTTSKSLDAMASDLHTANEDINTQAELIEEIAALVATKATPVAPGGSVETVALGILSYAPKNDNDCLYYINSSGTLIEFRDFPGMFGFIELVDVVKNSIICTVGSEYQYDDGIMQLVSGNVSLYHIIGDEPTLVKIS